MWAPTAWFAAILAGTDAAGLSQQHTFTTGDPTAENPPRGDGRHASGGSRPRASSWSAPPSTHLGGHHLGVGAADLHARIEASLVVGLHDVTSVHLICSNPTVIRAWGGGRRHQVNKALGKKSHQLGNRELCWSQRIYRNQTALPSTVHRSSDPKSRAQWWCNLSLIYVAQLDWQCMGRRPRDKQSWAGCARRHHPGSLSTSGSRHCSDNSRHCSCLEESAGCGFTGFFLIQPARGRSPPRLGEGRCCKQPVPVPGWVRRVGKPPAPSRRCLAHAPSRSFHQQPWGDFSGRALQPLTNKSCSQELFVQWGPAHVSHGAAVKQFPTSSHPPQRRTGDGMGLGWGCLL